MQKKKKQPDVLTFTNAIVKTNKKLEREYFKLSIKQGYGDAVIMQKMIKNHEFDDQVLRGINQIQKPSLQ